LAGSVHIGMFLAFRFVAGASAFMILAAVPILMNEIVPVHLRGALVDIHAVMLVLGYTIQGWVGFGFFFWKTTSNNTWRPPVAIQCFWPLCLLIALPFMPESPRWLCMKGRDEEARAILLRLHSDPSDPDNEVANAEFYQIQKQIAIDRTLGSSWVQIWKKPSYRKRAFLAIGTTGIVQYDHSPPLQPWLPLTYSQMLWRPRHQ
jgi:MFS family permease